MVDWIDMILIVGVVAKYPPVGSLENLDGAVEYKAFHSV